MRAIKIISVVFGAIVALLVVAAGLLLWLFDPNDYKDYLTRWVEEQTGRSFTIANDLELSFFPWLAVETGGIELGKGSTDTAAQAAVPDRHRATGRARA
jgi:AsmA protein